MRIINGILIAILVLLVVGCAAPKQTESLSYEVIKTYTIEVIVGEKPVLGLNGASAVDLRNKACVEIKNTGNTAGLFSVDFRFSEEYFGQDLIYLEPGETGVASYIPFQTVEGWRQGQKLPDFGNMTAQWDYDVTPVALNP